MPHPPSHNPPMDLGSLLQGLQPRLVSLYSTSRATEWKLTLKHFTAAVERSARKRFAEGNAIRRTLEEYLESLHIEDLILAAACMEGSEPAWEYFVDLYRGYLRAAAGAITKGSRSGADAQELADSLLAELFGLSDGKRGESSLLRYFHGRSSLKTWLRTVLAQRHVDNLRQSRRWESLEQEDGEEKQLFPQPAPAPLSDPHREPYLRRFVLALSACLEALDREDRKRLELYYAREKTLAEIGRLLGEHESSVSRNLERIRRELRAAIEAILRNGGPPGEPQRRFPPMDDASIAVCFEYAAADAPIDFRRIFPEKPGGRDKIKGKESS